MKLRTRLRRPVNAQNGYPRFVGFRCASHTHGFPARLACARQAGGSVSVVAGTGIKAKALALRVSCTEDSSLPPSAHDVPGARRPWLLPIVFLLGILAGCEGEPEAPPPVEQSRPIETFTVRSADFQSGLRFPGRVRAVQRAELAFNIPGQIARFEASEGETLAAGELIAALDPAAFEDRLAAARASYDKARVDYERVQQIWEKSKAVARAEVDRKRTTMEVARSDYAAARRDLEDTKLLAPFSGVLVHRYVENFQNVQAKEPVVSLQDVNELEIVIHVPERVMRREPQQAAGFAEFEDVPGRRFPVALKSYSADADPQTQTYEVVLGLTRPQDVKILPGMSAAVVPGDAAAGASGGSLMVPLKAVTAGPDGEPRVWTIDPESNRVSSRPVVTGAIRGDEIVILEGLAPGEQIATAGLSHLRDGMLVRPLG